MRLEEQEEEEEEKEQEEEQVTNGHPTLFRTIRSPQTTAFSNVRTSLFEFSIVRTAGIR